MSNKYWGIALALGLTVSFAIGRFTAPESIKTETVKTEDKTQNKDVVVDQQKHKQTTTTETVKPDGTKETTTVTTEDTNTDKKSDTVTTDNVSEITTKEVIKDTSKLSVSLLTGVNISSGSQFKMIYGGHITKNMLGPITGGIWVMTDGTGGVSLGLSF